MVGDPFSNAYVDAVPGVTNILGFSSQSEVPPPNELPAGEYCAVDSGVAFSLALSTCGELVAWGRNEEGQCDVPEGEYVSIAAGDFHGVALRADGSVAAWGANGRGQCEPPSGFFRKARFQKVFATWENTFGITTAGAIVAWGTNEELQCSRVPRGQFADLACESVCGIGIKSDGTLQSWGSRSIAPMECPAGQFRSVASKTFLAFGVTVEGDLKMWGERSPVHGNDTEYGLAKHPTGKFLEVQLDYKVGCAMREDRTLCFWGDGAPMFDAYRDTPMKVFSLRNKKCYAIPL